LRERRRKRRNSKETVSKSMEKAHCTLCDWTGAMGYYMAAIDRYIYFFFLSLLSVSEY